MSLICSCKTFGSNNLMCSLEFSRRSSLAWKLGSMRVNWLFGVFEMIAIRSPWFAAVGAMSDGDGNGD